MFPADSDEYWPELQQAIDHWERRISDDPGMFNQLVWGLMVATHRAEAAEAKLALVDEYGESQWHSGASGTEFEAGPSETFAEWLAQREELLQSRI